MKKMISILTMFFTVHCFSQSFIGSYPFTVTINKTSNIVFPYSIKGVDRGSADLLVQKAKGTENILQLKASKKNFDTTTLSVITSDGKLYPFLVSYEAAPKIFNLSFIKGEGKPFVMLSDETEDDASLDSDAILANDQPKFLNKKTRSLEMELELNGLFIRNHLLWFTFILSNHSQVPFEPSYIRFFIRDKSGAKRTARQEQRLTPIYNRNIRVVNAESQENFSCAFRLFTISKNKRLVIEVNEDHGSRLLELKLNSKTLLKARQIKE